MFLQVPGPLLRKFDVGGLYGKWDQSANLFTGRRVSPATLLAFPLLNLDLVQGFATAAQRLAAQKVRQASSRIEEVFVMIAQNGLAQEGEILFDPTIGRPGRAYHTQVNLIESLLWTLENQTVLFQSPEVRRGMISHWMMRTGAQLAEAKRLWFNPRSVGWLTVDERDATIEAMKASVDSSSREQLLKLWMEAGGSQSEFESLWTDYTDGMILVFDSLNNIPFTQDVRRGEEAYSLKLSRLRIPHSIREIREWAEKQYQLVATEMDRLAAIMDYRDWKQMWVESSIGEELPDDESLVEIYRQKAPEVIALLQDEGLIPSTPPNFSWSIEPTPESLRVSIPAAVCFFANYTKGQRVAMFYVTPIKGSKLSRIQHATQLETTIAHEVAAHAFGSGLAPLVVPLVFTTSRDTSLAPLEGLAFSMELQYLRVKPSLSLVFGTLQARLWRYARILAETDWHLTKKPFEQIVNEYADNAGLDNLFALRDVRRACQEIWEFCAYAVGASGVYEMGRHYQGGFKEAVSRLQALAGGFVPPNMFLYAENRIANPMDFNWLCETDPGVLVSRELVPMDSRSYEKLA